MKPSYPGHDCTKCQGLCCIATTRRGEMFGNKYVPTGKPCQHLTGAFKCRIHDQLPKKGFGGCMTYDCHGVGMRMTSLLKSAGIINMLNILHILESKSPLITPQQKEIARVIMYIFGPISNATTMLYDNVLEKDFQEFERMINTFYEEFQQTIKNGGNVYIFLIKAHKIFEELEDYCAKLNSPFSAPNKIISYAGHNRMALNTRYQKLHGKMMEEERDAIDEVSLKKMLFVAMLMRETYYGFPAIWKNVSLEEVQKITRETAEIYAGNNNSTNTHFLESEIPQIFREHPGS